MLGILPIFAFDHNQLPFRPLTVEEIAQVSGLTEQLDDLRRKYGHLSEVLVRNVCGNSFHPVLLAAALGNDLDLQEWTSKQSDTPSHQCHIPGPAQVLEHYKMLRLQVIQELSREQGDPQQVIQRDMASPCPFSHLQQDTCSTNSPDIAGEEVWQKVQPCETLPTPMVPDPPDRECTPLTSTCKSILIQL